jgi:hypothetical protein
MSAPGSYVDPEERERRLRELANRLVDEERVESDTMSQTKARICKYQAGFDSGVFEIHKD